MVKWLKKYTSSPHPIVEEKEKKKVDSEEELVGKEREGEIVDPKVNNPEEDEEFKRRLGKEPLIEETPKCPFPAPYPQRLKMPQQNTKSQEFLELFK